MHYTKTIVERGKGNELFRRTTDEFFGSSKDCDDVQNATTMAQVELGMKNHAEKD